MTNSLPLFLVRLGLTGDADERAIRRAYARLLKQTDQEAEPQAFQSLREAYEAALYWHALRLREVAQSPVAQEPSQPLEEQGVDAGEPPTQATWHEPGIREPDSGGQRQQAARDLAARDSEQKARSVLDALQAKLNVGWPRNRGEVATWLQQVLASEPLAGMDARFLFELGMASTLAEGWKPGKDLLLAPVIDGFGWRHDRGRLAGFGRPGAIVAAVLDELDYFDSLPERIRTQQRQLIRQLRDDKRPKTSLLMKQMKAVTHLTRMYPHWMHVITNTQNIERWQAWANQIPNWRRWLAGRPRDTGKPPLSLAPRFDGVGVTAIVLCLGLLGFTALFDPSRSVSAPPAPGPRPVSWSASALPGLNSPPALHEGELMGGGRPAVDAWYLTPPSMVYPPVARRLVQTGRVVVAVVIDANGQAGDVKVDTSSGHTILDNAALAAVRSAKYAPALNGAGKPVAAAYRLPFNFELEDGQSALLQPPRTYGEAVQAAVVPYIILPGQIVGNPQAEVTLQLASDGRILHQRLTHASGEPLWDAAVMRALQRVAKLPADPSGVVPPTMVIAFRPKS